ncbi:MAG TPA: serine hydrolase [Pyrinomonadaceae bacterium]|jgi:CubicO group peptidase (beta-lactamase class C family)|nr:serine hydrolase [Pyrinomonadaceae bacterium]
MSPTGERFRRAVASAALLLLLVICAPQALARQSDEQAVRAMDELLSKAYPANEPGAAVVVVKDGRTLLRKGYGMADMELGVRVEPDMVFRLGSITKQFTAVAVLMLAEQGKLSLSDDLTKFFPDYPTGGRRITVEHLLTHTSGIKSYTSIPAWLGMWRRDMTVKELTDLFRNEPMDFAPGERWSYNNSGYVLLGAIIEKLSGQTYEEFMRRNVFEPLGMKHTFYGSASRLIPRRVPGYTRGESGFENAAYLSMTHPYAAGSLLSNVDDLALWDAALYTDRPVRQASLEKAFTPFKLNDGTPTGYGYGWSRTTYEGHTVVEHGGGINGFMTFALRMPEDRLYVAVLQNRDSAPPVPGDLALRLAAIAVGRPLRAPEPVKVQASDLAPLVGVYDIVGGEAYAVREKDGLLFVQPGGGPRLTGYPLSATEFFFSPDSLDRLTFTKDAAGKVTGLRVTRRFGPPTVGVRADRPLPAERVAIKLAPEVLERYVGVYELAPTFSIAVTRRGEQLFAQATGQSELEISPETETTFFVKVVDAKLEFKKDAGGNVTGLVLHQGGRQVPGKKVK